MINNNNNSTNLNININRLSYSIDSSQQLSYIHFQPFRVSYSIINLKEKFLHSIQSKNILNTYQRLNFIKNQKHNILSSIKLTQNYHLFERNLIKKFFDLNKNVLSKKVLEQMWKSSQFCDLLLIVQGSEYLAHRLVLATCSHKFKQIFNKRKNDFVTRIHLRHSTHKSLQLILNYLYTDNIILTIRNIDDILTCTKELGIQKVIDLCITYLSQINKRTIFQILDIACKHDLSEVNYLAHKFLIQSIDECIQTKEFIDIAYWMLNQILSDVTIEKRQEFHVLDRTLQWLSCNHISNTDVIFELLNKIRWQNLTYLSLKEILAINYEILHIPIVKQYLIKKLNDIYNHQIENRRQKDSLLQTKYLSPTNSTVYLAINQSKILSSSSSSKSRCIHLESIINTENQTCLSIINLFLFSSSKVLIIGGGFHLDKTMTVNQNAENGLFAYNIEKDEWLLFVRLPDQRHHHKLIWFNNRIYVLGGSLSHPFEKEQVALTNWVYLIDRSSLTTFDQNKWQSIPPMLEQRVYFGCAVLNNKIWVAGGLGIDGKPIRSVEYYDPETNIWKLAKRLRSPRLGCSVSSFHNKLFIVGGYGNEKSKPTLSNVTIYDSEKKIWLKKQPLSIARCHGQMVTNSYSLYAIGGCTEFEKNDDDDNEIDNWTMLSLNLLDKYDVRQDKWITLDHMKQARHDLCAEIIDDRIFTLYGVNSKRNHIVRSMESYDINTGVWTTLSAHSDDYVIGAASCLITT
ncbi:unnamed protein product [Rotaria sp. Silwood2]|nr:unnamed protein product [Rotaria sp. Silwood2]CAF3294566.1 unnamed protein product [Rotaria sp. Silwood2]CAF4481262.1 unnamed protein product [Rotaria sp. Silwood2]CAF4486614.1 unnamed protein product [Rotaria sp. Silwood2]